MTIVVLLVLLMMVRRRRQTERVTPLLRKNLETTSWCVGDGTIVLLFFSWICISMQRAASWEIWFARRLASGCC